MAENTPDTGLEAFKHQNRVLLVFAPSPQDKRHLEQQRLFGEAHAGLAERDLRVLYLFQEAAEAEELAYNHLTAETARRLRKQFGVFGGAFIVLLVGKDGTEKARTEKPIQPANLFDTVDQMPMRRREMESRGQAGR